MHIKKFEAPTLQEALENVKRELGPEAIILQTKKHKRGFGLMSQGSVEITAAVSDRSLLKRAVTERKLGQKGMEKIKGLPAAKQAEIHNKVHDEMMESHLAAAMGAGNRDEVKIGGGARKAAQSAPMGSNSSTDPTGYRPGPAAKPMPIATPRSVVQSDLIARKKGISTSERSTQSARPQTQRRYIDIQDDDEISGNSVAKAQGDSAAGGLLYGTTSMPQAGQLSKGAPASGNFQGGNSVATDVEQLKRMVLELKSAQEDRGMDQATDGARSSARAEGLTSPVLQEAFELLLLNGIEKRFSLQLLRKVAFELGGIVQDADQVLDQIAGEILQTVKVVDFPFRKSSQGHPEVICVVGPTGVGKTTTVAKIASLALVKKMGDSPLKVGLINLDSYKVAANDQLATYARVLNVPFRAAANATELRAAMTDFQNLDLVILDTAGRSHRDPAALKEMETLIRTIPEVRTQLVVSATTRDTELADTASRFSVFKPEGVTVAKLDEATTYGTLYNLAVRSRLPFLFFATGQRVPEDIEAATPERVAALVLDLEF